MAAKKTKVPKPAPIKISELLDANGVAQQRQTHLNRAKVMSRSQQILVTDLVNGNPRFTVGDPANGGFRFTGSDAADILGGIVKILAAKEAESNTELVKLGVTFDKLDAIADAVSSSPVNRQAKRAKARALKKADKKAKPNKR